MPPATTCLPLLPRRRPRAERRLPRALCAERGSVLLEFALVAPLALAVIAFTIDFAHLTLTRQQLDICARFAADAESLHQTHYGTREVRTSGNLRNALRAYLVYTTQHPLLPPRKTTDVYLRYRQEGLPLLPVGAFLTGNGTALMPQNSTAGTQLIMKLFSAILKSALDLLTFRTARYATEPFASDYLLGASVSTTTNTLFPASLYAALDGGIGWDKDQHNFLLLAERIGATDSRRAYCYMPNRDPCVKRQPTYSKAVGDLIAKIRKKFGL